MNLFIFSSRRFSNIFIYFLFIFFIYNIYLLIFTPVVIMYQNQWQKNYAFAQEFIYTDNADKIIVGSSMSARMEKSFLNSAIENLSFTGGSVLTGLAVIRKKGIVPKVIYIETNVIFREKDNTLIDTVFFPITWKIKRYIPALQEKYQPLNIILTRIKGSYGKTNDTRMKEKVDKFFFDISYKIEEKRYNIKNTSYKKSLNELKVLIKYFEKSGTKIIFFEMPIDNRLSESIRAKEERKIIMNSFHNKWLNKPQNDSYKTSDGIHLLYKSAYEYSQIFMKEISGTEYE